MARGRLGRQLVPQPTPIQGGALITTGLYRFVRHPIYTAVLTMVAGSLLRTPSAAGAVTVAAAWVFLDRKAAHEERLLSAVYPEYDAYCSRVRSRLLPGLR